MARFSTAVVEIPFLAQELSDVSGTAKKKEKKIYPVYLMLGVKLNEMCIYSKRFTWKISI